MERHIFSVTEVNELVKLLLDNEPMLSGICVRGEISNYKMYPSGHHYFSLKDPTGAIRCVMFKGAGSASAVSSGKRHEGAGDGPGQRLSPGRRVSALLRHHDPGGGGGSGAGL